MTDEEYDALDVLLTKTTPRLTKVTGPLTRQRQLPNPLEVEGILRDSHGGTEGTKDTEEESTNYANECELNSI